MTQSDLLQPGWSSRFQTVNGVNLHVVEAGPTAGRPVILLHGFPEFWWAWRRQIQPLADAGFRVIVPDMRGYNLSEAPGALRDYHLDTLACDVTALGSAMGLDRFDLVSHDWGGVVAWRVAARDPHRVRRLVVMDAPHPDIFAGQILRHPGQALRSTYAMFFQLPWLPEAALSAFDFAGLRRMMTGTARPGVFTRADMDHYAEAWERPGRFTAMLNYYRALRERHPGRPDRIGVPTLILWGSRDSALAVHVARASLGQCDAGRLEVIEGATHWVQHEEPARVLDLTLAHLRAG